MLITFSKDILKIWNLEYKIKHTLWKGHLKCHYNLAFNQKKFWDMSETDVVS